MTTLTPDETYIDDVESRGGAVLYAEDGERPVGHIEPGDDDNYIGYLIGVEGWVVEHADPQECLNLLGEYRQRSPQ